MSSNKQILVIVMSIIICSDGYALRKKREGPEAIASFFIDKAAEGMAILEHGAAYKGQQDHQLDFFGAQAGIDVKPKVGFGDAIREDTSGEDTRRKRQAEGEQQDPEAKEIQGMFHEMWQTMVEGGKKIIKKFANMIDRDGSQRPEGQESETTF
ncbi:uncharacterized protein [Chironomus tepperi]|uniref:uncharacterized protein n=1 Tax=Chironomus tepperi TaxID=113505 RepID=UPI00391F3E20